MDFNKFFFENFTEKEYEKYMSAWLGGIIDEISFWDTYFALDGWMWKDGYKSAISYERDFVLESFVGHGGSTVCLDVGSGPLSSCGSKTNLTRLEFHAVDPLAFVYKEIKKKYKIKTKIQPEFAMVEQLNYKFNENSFDLVHMRNSLDHSFNPIIGLMQLLYVCKVGGKVILMHRDNEAEFEKNGGFHQWNLQVKDNSFYIWRGIKKFNVSELFSEYIHIEMIPSKSREELHKVIITKKAPISLVEDSLLEIYHRRIFNKLLECLMNDFYIRKTKEQSKAYQFVGKMKELRKIFK